jgi:hypothetical protein
MAQSNVAGIFFAEVHQPVDMNVTYMEGETNTEAGLVGLMQGQAYYLRRLPACLNLLP